MELTKEKIIQIIGFFIIVIAIAVGLWFFFFRDDTPPQYVIIDGEAVPIGELPQIGDNLPPGIVIDPNTGLPVLIDNPEDIPEEVVTDEEEVETEPSDIAQGGETIVNQLARGTIGYFSTSSGGDVRYYDAENGYFYRITDDGPERLGDAQFPLAESVSWNKRTDQAIIEFPDSSNVFYDFNTGKQVTLPQQMTEFDFSFDGSSISYEWENEYDDQDNWIGIASPDGTEIQFLEAIGDKNDRVQVQNSPDGRYVAWYMDSTGLDRQSIIPMGKYGENFKSLEVYGRGFESQWSPDGKTMLYSVHSEGSDRKPELWIAQVSGDSVGEVNRPLGITTWAHKCTFDASGSTAYCAIPKELPNGVGWFPELANDYEDAFYTVDLKTGGIRLLADPVGSRSFYNATQLQLSPDGTKLYFVDGLYNDLMYINL